MHLQSNFLVLLPFYLFQPSLNLSIPHLAPEFPHLIDLQISPAVAINFFLNNHKIRIRITNQIPLRGAHAQHSGWCRSDRRQRLRNTNPAPIQKVRNAFNKRDRAARNLIHRSLQNQLTPLLHDPLPIRPLIHAIF